MAGVLLPNGGFLYGDSSIVPAPPAPTPGEWTPWEDAGGAVPSLGAVDVFGSGATPVAYTAAVVQSSWSRIGTWCAGHFRIKGTASGSLTGAMTVDGLPVPPQYQDAGADGGGSNIATDGFILDGSDAGRKYKVGLVIDPTFSTTTPILFCDFGMGTADGVTNVALVPSFAGTPHDLVLGNSPFDWNGKTFFINVSLMYQGDL